MRYLWDRGDGSRRRVLHLCGYDPRSGRPTMRPICGDARRDYNTTMNAPAGRPICKRCQTVLIDGTMEP